MPFLNKFAHNGTRYYVWYKKGFNGQKIVHIYKSTERDALVGTTFGKTALENDIMEWAKRCIAKNFAE